jgi:ornithine carbamoyltransferase
MDHLISVQDLSVQEILAIFKRTREFKKRPVKPVLRNKTLAMIFQKPSTRTRVSFEVAMHHLGGHALYLNYQDIQLWRGETISDTARVLSRYVDGIVARVYSHKDIIKLAESSGVPVINGLSDLLHPCQILADIYTMHEHLGYLRDIKVAFVGAGRDNIANSLCLGCSKMGINLSVACPRKLAPDKGILRQARANSRASRATIEVVSDPAKAAKGADVLYTDTWFSMGEKRDSRRLGMMKRYQLNSSLLDKANRHCLVMHCLPAHRGEEITDSAMDGTSSVILDQAENRLHVQKGILSLLL